MIDGWLWFAKTRPSLNIISGFCFCLHRKEVHSCFAIARAQPRSGVDTSDDAQGDVGSGHNLDNFEEVCSEWRDLL